MNKNFRLFYLHLFIMQHVAKTTTKHFRKNTLSNYKINVLNKIILMNIPNAVNSSKKIFYFHDFCSNIKF